jgi:hypothetical protein
VGSLSGEQAFPDHRIRKRLITMGAELLRHRFGVSVTSGPTLFSKSGGAVQSRVAGVDKPVRDR